jgi:hypothetical protein
MTNAKYFFTKVEFIGFSNNYLILVITSLILKVDSGKLIVEGWKVGRLEGWEVGKLESWKVGRFESGKLKVES